jgi:hypothetical protein
MARTRNYGQFVAAPGGRSFYSNPCKRSRRERAPVTPALRDALTKRREERQTEYTSALKGARDEVLSTQVEPAIQSKAPTYIANTI